MRLHRLLGDVVGAGLDGEDLRELDGDLVDIRIIFGLQGVKALIVASSDLLFSLLLGCGEAVSR